MSEDAPRYLHGGPPQLPRSIQRFSGPRSRAWELTDRADQLEREGREIIHLGVGDPDFDTPTAIVDAAVDSLRRGRTHYSPIPGEVDLRTTIADITSNRYGLDIDTTQVCIFPGAQCALFAAVMCLTEPNDEVILLEPFYATYEGVARAGGAQVVSVPLSADRGFGPDLDKIEKAINSKTRVILANSPGNPTGGVFSQDAWTSLVDICRRNSVWLISDEVYSDYVYEGEHFSPISLPEGKNNVVVVNSISKSHAMTGWRLGWTIAPQPLARQLDNLAQFLLFGVSQFTQDAVNFALQECSADVTRLNNAFQNRRDVLCDELAKIDGLTCHKPAGGMFVMVDVSALGLDGEQFATALLEHSGVAVVPGFGFGDSASNYVRIGFLVDETRIKKAADKIGDFVSSL
ncbi:MAG: arginine:pyruvate transaminase [Woeseiaceae bacterium]|jgi:arginine:pyruvate transaminase